MLKPDSTRYPFVDQTRSAGPEWIDPDPSDIGPAAGNAAAFHSQKDLPTSVALDQRLLEVLQQARLATSADGALIALARGDQMVCRATLGDKAPSAGVRLNTRSGLGGACAQTREMQLCDDAMADPRVNVIASRDLGIRSIVVLPVLDGAELWGVLEVFSSEPGAFSESDLQTLQALSRKISHTVREAIEGGSTGLVLEAFSRPLERNAVRTEPAEPEAQAEPDPQHAAIAGRDYRTGALTAAVLALAVFLGWMVGRVGWTLAVNRAPAHIAMTSEGVQAVEQATPDPAPALPRKQEQGPAIPVTAKPGPATSVKPALKPKAEAAKPPELNGDLVVYEHGKVVFRIPPSKVESPSQAEPGVAASDAIQQAATREEDSPAVPSPIPPPAANSYLLARVEPEYPEAARQQRIQGPVVLNVLVGADGLVREVSVISGDPQLTKAATDAVRQWRFNPHQLKGKAVEFETRITVNFALPK